jgi:hypothetical protein
VGGAYPSFLHDAVGVVGDPSVPIAVLVCLGCLLVTAVTAWGLLRDIPVAAKTS